MNYALDEITSDELKEIKKELQSIDSEYELTTKNFGEGADWVMILATIYGITSVFLLGDKINTGLEGWIKIGKRIKNIFSKTDKSYIDFDAAKILGVNHLSEKYDLKSIKVVMQSELPIKDLSKMLLDRSSDDFTAKPFCVYFITYEINDRYLVILGIKSDGEINEHYQFDKDDFRPF